MDRNSISHNSTVTWVVLTALLLGACSETKAPSTIESAERRLAKGEDRAAVVDLHGVLQANPASAKARYLLGRTLLAAGDAAGAEIELKKARELKHPEAEVAPLLARAMVDLQRHKLAIEQFSGLSLQNQSAQDDLNAALASAWATSGKRDKARSLLDAVVARNPNHAWALMASARLRATDGQFDPALAEAKKATIQEPRNADAWLTLSQIQLIGKQDTQGATESLRKVLALRPGSATAHSSLIAIAFAKGDDAAASAGFKEMAKVLPQHPQTRVVEVQMAIKDKDLPKAKERLLELLKLAPDNPDLLQLAGITEMGLGNVSRAIGHFQRAIYLAPESSAHKAGLARAYLRSGQPKRTLQTLETNLARNPHDPTTLSLAAEAELLLGNAAGAEALFLRALKSKPGDATLRTSVAMAQMSQGKSESALAELKALAKSETNPVGDLALISSMIRQRNVPGALAAIDGLQAKLPTSAQPDTLRGQLLLAKGDIAGARTSYEAALKKEAQYMPAVQGMATIDIREGKPAQAEGRFTAVLAKDPKNTGAMMALVNLKARKSATSDEIGKLLSDGIAASPNDPAPRLRQLQFLLDRRDRKGALSAAQAAASALPDNLDLLTALGKVQLLAGDANQAVATFGKVAAREPQSAQPLLYQAEAYVQLKDTGAAERSYKRALDLAPTSLDAQRGLVALSVRTNNLAKALEAARSVQRQNPKIGLGYMLEGDIHGKFNDWASAAKAYRAGLEKGNFVGLSERLYTATLKTKGEAAAAAFAVDWIKQHPEDAGLPYFLGTQASIAGNFEQAEGYLTSAVKANAKLVAPLNNLAWAKVKLGRPDALAVAQQAHALAPERLDVIDTLVLALRQAQQEGKAVELLKATVQQTPEAHAARLLLAQIYADAGDRANAKRELEVIVKSTVPFARRSEAAALLLKVSS